MNNGNSKVVTFGPIDIDPSREEGIFMPDSLPILPTRDLVLFPGVTFPIRLGRESTIATAKFAEQHGLAIGVLCQENPATEVPQLTDMMNYGVVADIIRIFELPDAPVTAIVRARDKFKVLGPGKNMPGVPFTADVKTIREPVPRKSDKEMVALAGAVKEAALSILKKTTDAPTELSINIEGLTDPVMTVNLIATHTPLPPVFKMQLLEAPRPKERAFKLLTELARNEQMVDISREIHERTHKMMSEQQRNVYLQNQMDAIRQELYGDEGPEADVRKLKEKASALPLPDDVKQLFERECAKLSRLAPQSPDYSVLQSYLELLTDLPWGKMDPLNTDIKAAEEVLEADHYGLEKVKERILEQIALLINAPDGHAPILCLVGAPGVGKTSLGQSIARALGRKYRRVALGGLHDEAEIRGHRRTYIGAMPGRIIDALRRSGSANPVMLLDEIDKLGSDYKGDPSAALLEVLDPEQNCRFHDNYVDVDFDLSKVLFIATANTLSTVPAPLLDRMEVIDISGYLPEEKIEIARRHLLPRIVKEAGLTAEEVELPDATIEALIDTYTSESGVRQLEKRLAAIVRKIVLRKVSGKPIEGTVTPDSLTALLGPAPYIKDRYEGNDYAGVVTGLAWTAAGGCVLSVESSLSAGKGDKLVLTGNLGDVMKESATIALQYARANADSLGIRPEEFENRTLHIHVPEGAIPKDGPSAGITMATSIVSAFTGRKVRERIAMTGELTLRGKVLPIGGVKEKILAAKRAGITDVILPEANRKDVEDIPEKYLSGLTVHYVGDISQVIDLALLPAE
ncbi:MAG: endopeptidase La [Bacteroides sp.]|nr:endopeptidase La [Bacteroides sp.]